MNISGLAQLFLGGTEQAMLLGTWFGLLHSFDADHLATLGGLAVNNRKLSATGYALRWALGHAVALGTIAAFVLGLGLSGLLDVTAHGDVLVGVVLLGIGTRAVHAVWQRHRAAGATTVETDASAAPADHAGRLHFHLFAPYHTHSGAGRSGRAGVALGILHGGAGSAAVLALLLLTQLHSGLEDAVYLLCFSLGVAGGALTFAALFARLAARTTAVGTTMASAFQAIVGMLAIGTGTLLLVEMLYGCS